MGGDSEIAADRSAAAFIQRWAASEGAERANYALFLAELCDLIGVERPRPSTSQATRNDYTFERAVTFRQPDGSTSTGRIDLYKRGSFVLEAKQSREAAGPKAQVDLFGEAFAPAPRGRRSAARGWDVLMLNARQQAEDYARALPTSEGWPPFLVVCDVGHCIELFADFSGQGKNYAQFPDRQGFRIYLDDLAEGGVRERLRHVWDDPLGLDPSRRAARVTRDIAERLATVSRHLEAARLPTGRRAHDPEMVALFLMRCLFTMFAEDVGLLPKASFRTVLARCAKRPDLFEPLVGQLWEAMDEGRFAHAIEARVPRFNGFLFKDRTVLPLPAEEIGELLAAASADWREVEPAIFGTLLEQALDPDERRRLGAHYTPRTHVERLVVATIIEPLRAEWMHVQAAAETHRKAADAKRPEDARAERRRAASLVRAFHDKLCGMWVLDPACGTGNFLYVALELVKRLEGEVLEALADLGGQESLSGLDGSTVGPDGFLGMEVNPRAAAIAELVLWIGYLQWHFRTQGGAPGEPILRDTRTIWRSDAVLTYGRREMVPDGAGGERVKLANPQRPDWPTADYIVGNPPFLGGKDLRSRLGNAYAEALWTAHPHMNNSADLVMYWWDRAADLLTRKGTRLKRFGFVTTNSITQTFQRRAVERHMAGKVPVSLLMAIPDHPWTKATRDAAAVRVAMTVAAAGEHEGTLLEVAREAALDSDQPVIETRAARGRINADLTVGADVTKAAPLRANEGLCSPGVKLHGAGFIVSPAEAQHLGLGRREGLEARIRPYRNGRDLMARSRDAMVIDLDGLSSDEVRRRFPEVYQHLLLTVKPERDRNNEEYRRLNWWLFGRRNTLLRGFTAGLSRYIATVETAKHRVFQFLDASILPDNKLIALGLDDAFLLGVLSSRTHVTWALRAGGWLGIGNDSVYVKSRVFDPFPFPDASDALADRIRYVAEELDAHRKRVLSDHPDLTLTGLYNVLEALRAGAPCDAKAEDVRGRGLVVILAELHDRLDALVAEAYNWPANISENEVLARLVALNAERAAEERRGQVRWLRPAYQAAHAGRGARDAAEQFEAALVGAVGSKQKPAFPADPVEATAAVMAALFASVSPVDATAIAARFRGGRANEPRIAALLGSLARLGHLTRDVGGDSFALHRS